MVPRSIVPLFAVGYKLLEWVGRSQRKTLTRFQESPHGRKERFDPQRE